MTPFRDAPAGPPPDEPETPAPSAFPRAVADPPEDDKSDDAPEGPAGDMTTGHSAVRVLMARSRLAQAMKDIPRYENILIIEDDPRESDRLASTLRTIFGYDIKIRQCVTLGTALDAVLSDQPDLVFLDDRMGPIDKAEKSVPFLRTARCEATIIVVSSYIDRRRRAEIMQLEVGYVIDKDELDSTSICQALVDARRPKR